MGTENYSVAPEDFHEFRAEVRAEVSELKGVMGKVVEALNRIAVFEERQQTVALTTNKILERVENIERRQHAADIDAAQNSNAKDRLAKLEESFQSLNLDNERHKAQFKTFTWLVRGLWTVIGGSGAIWILQALVATHPVK